MDQVNGDRPAGRTSSVYLKPWPVCIFKDLCFSLYIVAASESDEGLVYIMSNRSTKKLYFEHFEITPNFGAIVHTLDYA